MSDNYINNWDSNSTPRIAADTVLLKIVARPKIHGSRDNANNFLLYAFISGSRLSLSPPLFRRFACVSNHLLFLILSFFPVRMSEIQDNGVVLH